MNVTLFGQQGLCSQVQARPYEVGVSPKSNDWSPYKKREIWTQILMEKEINVTTWAKTGLELGGECGTHSLPEPLEGANLAVTLAWDFWHIEA